MKVKRPQPKTLTFGIDELKIDVLDDVTKQCIECMYNKKEAEQQANQKLTSFYKYTDEDLKEFERHIKDSFADMELKQKQKYYANKKNYKFVKALLKSLEQQWKEEMIKRGFLK